MKGGEKKEKSRRVKRENINKEGDSRRKAGEWTKEKRSPRNGGLKKGRLESLKDD